MSFSSHFNDTVEPVLATNYDQNNKAHLNCVFILKKTKNKAASGITFLGHHDNLSLCSQQFHSTVASRRISRTEIDCVVKRQAKWSDDSNLR